MDGADQPGTAPHRDRGIDSDEDLQAFVRSLVTRLESPARPACGQGGTAALPAAASRRPVGAPAGDAGAAQLVRVEKGAVTERHVRDAAAHGSHLMLARGAVLTPLARDSARSLGVQIEREGKC